MSDSRTKPITDEERALWRRLCEEATSGPWLVRKFEATCGYLDWQIHEQGHGGHLASTSEMLDDDPSKSRRDAAFIATAREALPRLLEYVEQLESKNVQLVADWNTQTDELLQVIADLVDTQDLKRAIGKTPEYYRKRELAWKVARTVLGCGR